MTQPFMANIFLNVVSNYNGDHRQKNYKINGLNYFIITLPHFSGLC